MDLTHHWAAGREWVYCQRVRQGLVKVHPSLLFVSVLVEDLNEWQRHQMSPIIWEKIADGKHPATCVDLDPDKYDIIYQAYEDAGLLTIPSNHSFRQLILSIELMGGIPTPYAGKDPGYIYPPVLRLFAVPKDRDSPDEFRGFSPSDDEDDPEGDNQHGDRGRERSDEDGESPDERPSPPKRQRADKSAEPSSPDTPQRVRVDKTEIPTIDRLLMDFSVRLNKRIGGHEDRYHSLYAEIAGLPRNRVDMQNPDHKYKPPYSRVSLNPHQLYFTGWVLGNPNRIVHYLADRPGMGKTYETLELAVRVTLIKSNAIAIQDERDGNVPDDAEPLHMHAASGPGDPELREDLRDMDQCYANTLEQYGFKCQCETESALNRRSIPSYFSRGYILVIAPPNLTTQWEQQINDFLLDPKPNLPHNNQPFKVINAALSDRKNAYIKELLLGDQHDVDTGTIVIVGSTNGLGGVVNAFKEQGDNPDLLDRQPSIILWDESQKIQSDNQTLKLIEGLITRSRAPVHVIPICGTPATRSLDDFGVIERIAKHPSMGEWYGPDEYAEFTRNLDDTMTKLKARLKAIEDSEWASTAKDMGTNAIPKVRLAGVESDLDEYDAACWAYTSALPLLQRDETSDYFDYALPAYSGAAPEVMRFNVKMNQAQRRVAKGWKRRVINRWRDAIKGSGEGSDDFEKYALGTAAQAGVLNDRASEATQLATFAPGLARGMPDPYLQARSYKFTAEVVKDIFSHRRTAQREAAEGTENHGRIEQLFTQTPGIGRIHPKIDAICNIIDEMLVDNEKYSGQPDDQDAVKKKALIIVPHAYQGYLLLCYLFKKYPDHDFSFLGSFTNQEARDRLLEPFMQSPTKVGPDDDNGPIALISTPNFIGEGLNLIRCNYCISTSPLDTRGKESQLFARIRRYGQVFTTHCYILLDEGSPPEFVLFQSSRRRQLDTVPEDEHGYGFEFLFGEPAEWGTRLQAPVIMVSSSPEQQEEEEAGGEDDESDDEQEGDGGDAGGA